MCMYYEAICFPVAFYSFRDKQNETLQQKIHNLWLDRASLKKINTITVYILFNMTITRKYINKLQKYKSTYWKSPIYISISNTLLK